MTNASERPVALITGAGRGIGRTGSASNRDDLADLVAATLDSYGRIDAVVNNTGHPPTGPLLEITDERWAEANEAILLSVQRMRSRFRPQRCGAARPN